MKKFIIISILIVLIPIFSYCQNSSDTFELKDISIPVSPAFSLLDITPKTIERPGTVKAFTISVVNQVNQSSGIPKNFAMEFAPFWMFKHPDMTIFKYYGIDNGTNKLKMPNVFYGLRSTSISIGTIAKDSTRDLPININYLAYSIKSNVINIRKKIVIKALSDKIKSINEKITDILADTICNNISPDTPNYDSLKQACIAAAFARDRLNSLNVEREEFSKMLTIKPLFSMDLAAASSTAFANNSYDTRHSYRSAGWVNFVYSQQLKRINKASDLVDVKDYLNIYGLFRIIHQDSTRDFKTFVKRDLVDVGGRIELELNRFSISLETIYRTMDKFKDENSSRTVAILQYKITSNLFISGSFGKNFNSQQNLVSLFGLNWGLGSSSLYSKFK